MKKINQLLFLFLATTATFLTSCSTDIEPIDPAVLIPNPSANGELKVDIDGQTFVATNVQAVVNSTAIAISGLRSGNNDFIQITLPSPLNQVGTYNWANATTNNVVLGLIYSNSASEGFVSAPTNGDFAAFPEYTDTASITITSIDANNKKISGTFQFTGGRFNSANNLVLKKFTNGSFSNISYSGDIPSSSNNAFSAKVNGTSFVASSITAAKLSNMVTVSGVKQGVETISLMLPETITPGTYQFETFGGIIGFYVVDTTQNGTFNAASGTLTISVHNTTTKKLTGTFNFVASSFINTITHTITDGEFNVTYQ